jgi:hypothetical protein
MGSALDDLAEVTGALFQADVARLRTIASEESAIRSELVALERQERAAFLPADNDAIALRSIQADLNWRGWISRKREMLNMQLANVLVKKAQAMHVLRKSYGRRSVAEQLSDQSRDDARAEQATRNLIQIQEHGMNREWAKRRDPN